MPVRTPFVVKDMLEAIHTERQDVSYHDILFCLQTLRSNCEVYSTKFHNGSRTKWYRGSRPVDGTDPL
jgi:hypothetical protein